MTQATTPPEIILDGVSYSINNFSQTIQAMVNMRNRWETELSQERAAVLKTESAIRSLDDQLSKIVTEELAVKSSKQDSAKASSGTS